MHFVLWWWHHSHVVATLMFFGAVSMTTNFDVTAVDMWACFLDGLGGEEGAHFLPPLNLLSSTTTSSSPASSTSISETCIPIASSLMTSPRTSLLSPSSSESFSNSLAVMDSFKNKSSFSCWHRSLHMTLLASSWTNLSFSSGPLCIFLSFSLQSLASASPLTWWAILGTSQPAQVTQVLSAMASMAWMALSTISSTTASVSPLARWSKAT